MKGLQTIDRAVQVLEVIGAASTIGARMIDVMRATGLGRATSHRFLKAMLDQQLVEHDTDTGRYFLGLKLLMLSNAASNRFGLARHAAPALRRLAERTGDTVYLSVRVGDLAFCLDRVEGAFPIRTLTLKIGDCRPLGVGAGSMALLAFLPIEEVRRLVTASAAAIAVFGLDEANLLSIAQTARRLGYAFNDGRIIPGMGAVGVPVCGKARIPIAALSVAAITSRMSPSRRNSIVSWLKEEAATLETELGAVLDHVAGPSRATLLGKAAA
jgi:DNA-binding IclR family transcriptional regulator